MLRVCVHVAAHRDLDEGDDGEHLVAAYDVLEKYGLNREAVEGFIDNCRGLAEEYEAGEQAEEMIEDQMEEFFAQFDEDDATRNTLIRMQSDLYSEMMELANSAFTAMISESDRLLKFIHELVTVWKRQITRSSLLRGTRLLRTSIGCLPRTRTPRRNWKMPLNTTQKFVWSTRENSTTQFTRSRNSRCMTWISRT